MKIFKGIGSAAMLFAFIFIGGNAKAHDLDAVTDTGKIDYYTAPASQGIQESPYVSGDGLGIQNLSHQVPEEIGNVVPEMESRLIHGPDNRRIVGNTTTYPYSTSVYMEMKFPKSSIPYIGSGHMVSEDVVLTAGHCLYDKSLGGWATSVTVYPGFNGVTAPYGSAYAVELNSVKGWTENASYEHDIGAIKLNRKIGKNTGSMGYSTNTTGAITLTGFHGDLRGKMATETGAISRTTANNIFYRLDNTGGSSGSGVYNSSNHILGVNAYSSSPDNFATRITSEKYNILYKWITGKYPVTPPAPVNRKTYTEINKTVLINKVEKSIDTLPWGQKGFAKIASSAQSVGKVVKITQDSGDYVFSPELKGWIDKKGTEEIIGTSVSGTIQNGGYSIDQLPWYAGVVKLGDTTSHRGKKITVTGKKGAYYYAENLGWIDKKAFNPELQKAVDAAKNTNVTTNTKSTTTEINKTATVNSVWKSIDTLPWGMKGYGKVDSTDRHIGKTIYISQECGPYVFSPDLKGWIDKKGLNIK